MHIQEMRSCCSVIELSDLYDTERTQKEFIEYIAEFIFDNYKTGYYQSPNKNEIATCIIASTTNEQTHMNGLLEENNFKRIPFYGRHQECHLQETGKRNKYMNFWIKTSLPKGVHTELNKLIKRNR